MDEAYHLLQRMRLHAETAGFDSLANHARVEALASLAAAEGDLGTALAVLDKGDRLDRAHTNVSDRASSGLEGPAAQPDMSEGPECHGHSRSRPGGLVTRNPWNTDRTSGHNFKPTGFAYSRPLTFTQLKCYRAHARLLRSLNHLAPVECAVCHMDDDHEHFMCSWCAVRMCRYCRTAFGEGGVTALRARITDVEAGGGGASAGSPVESFGGGGRAWSRAG